MRLPSVANQRLHWAAKAAQASRQRAGVTLALRSLELREGLTSARSALARGEPVEVYLTRISPRPIRDTWDNLRRALKAPVDSVAEALGVDDSDPLLRLQEPQQESGRAALRIEIRAHGSKGAAP